MFHWPSRARKSELNRLELPQEGLSYKSMSRRIGPRLQNSRRSEAQLEANSNCHMIAAQ